MSCEAQGLVEASNCYTCLTEAQLLAIKTRLLCDWNITPPVDANLRVTEAGDFRVTDTGDSRIWSE